MIYLDVKGLRRTILYGNGIGQGKTYASMNIVFKKNNIVWNVVITFDLQIISLDVEFF